MSSKIEAFDLNNTWTINEFSQAKNLIGCRSITKLKNKSDDFIERYKTLLQKVFIISVGRKISSRLIVLDNKGCERKCVTFHLRLMAEVKN